MKAAITASRARKASGSVIGSNRRRRTISKPSSALAGRHVLSMRAKVCSSRRRASCPPSPPISMSLAGSEATTSTPGTAFAASVSHCANVRFASKSPAGRLAFP